MEKIRNILVVIVIQVSGYYTHIFPLLERVLLKSQFGRGLHRFEPFSGLDPSADLRRPNAIPLLCAGSFVRARSRFV